MKLLLILTLFFNFTKSPLNKEEEVGKFVKRANYYRVVLDRLHGSDNKEVNKDYIYYIYLDRYSSAEDNAINNFDFYFYFINSSKNLDNKEENPHLQAFLSFFQVNSIFVFVKVFLNEEPDSYLVYLYARLPRNNPMKEVLLGPNPLRNFLKEYNISTNMPEELQDIFYYGSLGVYNVEFKKTTGFQYKEILNSMLELKSSIDNLNIPFSSDFYKIFFEVCKGYKDYFIEQKKFRESQILECKHFFNPLKQAEMFKFFKLNLISYQQESLSKKYQEAIKKNKMAKLRVMEISLNGSFYHGKYEPYEPYYSIPSVGWPGYLMMCFKVKKESFCEVLHIITQELCSAMLSFEFKEEQVCFLSIRSLYTEYTEAGAKEVPLTDKKVEEILLKSNLKVSFFNVERDSKRVMLEDFYQSEAYPNFYYSNTFFDTIGNAFYFLSKAWNNPRGIYDYLCEIKLCSEELLLNKYEHTEDKSTNFKYFRYKAIESFKMLITEFANVFKEIVLEFFDEFCALTQYAENLSLLAINDYCDNSLKQSKIFDLFKRNLISCDKKSLENQLRVIEISINGNIYSEEYNIHQFDLFTEGVLGYFVFCFKVKEENLDEVFKVVGSGISSVMLSFKIKEERVCLLASLLSEEEIEEVFLKSEVEVSFFDVNSDNFERLQLKDFYPCSNSNVYYSNIFLNEIKDACYFLAIIWGGLDDIVGMYSYFCEIKLYLEALLLNKYEHTEDKSTNFKYFRYKAIESFKLLITEFASGFKEIILEYMDEVRAIKHNFFMSLLKIKLETKFIIDVSADKLSKSLHSYLMSCNEKRPIS